MNAELKTCDASERDLTNAIRFLTADAVQAANSGHPGAPMGMAEIALVLWRRHLKHNPANPAWPDRDRFVLSNGHGSMLLYALLHLTGYDLPIGEIRRFRQLHSKTPGHPEYGMTAGVETTTDPLGQGLANAVGMALAEALLAREFNREAHAIVDHRTYVFLGDGCLMEGISHEACSLAGTLKLGKLIGFYDDNGISIDGHVEHWFADDTPRRFEAYGWHVVRNVDGHDTVAIERALLEAQSVADRPSLICCKTVIGKGAPIKAGTHDVHGAALGNDEIAAARKALGWPHAPFFVPADVYAGWDARQAGGQREAQWQRQFDAYANAHPELAVEFLRRTVGELPRGWPEFAREKLGGVQQAMPNIATRKASQNALDLLQPKLPELLGGSADLTGSNLTNFKGSVAVRKGNFGPDFGNHINYGVREFGMSAIMNGIALHGGHIPYGGTFLAFSDYSRNAIRMSALMGLRVIYVFTHDSIGLGEDGPTHQPIEHAASLRLIPNVHVQRPCDATETLAAWIAALEHRNGPTCLILSRQSLPNQPRTPAQCAAIARGGYVLADGEGGHADAVAIATGSEVALAVKARETLADGGIRLRIVSIPDLKTFEEQPADYRAGVLPPGIPRIAIEAGATGTWHRLVGDHGRVIGIERFGESAPADKLFELFGLTPESIAAHVRELVGAAAGGRSMSGIRIRAVLFDLDGTLVDSAPDIAAAMNRALEEFRLSALPLTEIAARVGKGPRVLAERVLAAQPGLLGEASRERLLEPLLTTYLDHYNATIGKHGRLFPHVAETLLTLRARGLKLAVVTNALQSPAQSILERYGIAEAIDLLLGGDRVVNRKPHPESLETACRWLGVGVDETVMVGDSNNDVAAARGAGCEIVCVPYGYNEGRPVTALDCDIVENFAFLPGWIATRDSRSLAQCREDTH